MTSNSVGGRTNISAHIACNPNLGGVLGMTPRMRPISSRWKRRRYQVLEQRGYHHICTVNPKERDAPSPAVQSYGLILIICAVLYLDKWTFYVQSKCIDVCRYLLWPTNQWCHHTPQCSGKRCITSIQNQNRRIFCLCLVNVCKFNIGLHAEQNSILQFPQFALLTKNIIPPRPHEDPGTCVVHNFYCRRVVGQ